MPIDFIDDLYTYEPPMPQPRRPRPIQRQTINPRPANPQRNNRAINIDERYVPVYPTTEQIKVWAKANNVKRRNVRICKHCGKMHSNNHKHCPICKERKTDIRWFKNYNTKPAPRFYHINKIEPLYYMGMEMEVVNIGKISKEDKRSPFLSGTYNGRRDGGDDKWFRHREYLSSIMSKIHRREFYAKSDASVELEIVSHPMSYEYIKQYWSETYGTMVKIFREHNCKSWISGPTPDHPNGEAKCGAHIHVSRSVGKMTIFKLLKIFYDKQNWSFLQAISGRDDLIRDHFCGLKLMIDYYPQPMQLFKNNNTHGNRYIPINFENEHTVELRIFRGSLNENRLMFYFQWTASMLEYLRNEKMMDVSIAGFVNFIAQHANTYRVVDYYFAFHPLINKTIEELTHVRYSSQFKKADKRRLSLELSEQ